MLKYVAYKNVLCYNRNIVKKEGGERMSILDSIKKSESLAEEMKKKAMEEVNLLLENNKKEITEKVDALYKAGEEKRKQIDANTQIVIANKKKEIDLNYQEKNQSIINIANERLKAVVDDVLKKVLQP